MNSSTRVAYHDFKAYTKKLANGKYQGFVQMQHHTLAGSVQTVFRAGKSADEEADAFARAESKVADLIRIISPD